MSRSARAYVYTVIFAAAAVSVDTVLSLTPSPIPWLTFVALTLLGIFTTFYRVESAHPISLQAETIFFFAGLFLLPDWMFLAQVSTVLLVAWLGQRRGPARLLRLFHIPVIILAGSGARLVWAGIGGGGGAALISTVNVAGVIAAALVYSLMNRVLDTLALNLLEGKNWDEPRTLRDIFLVEFPQACLGYLVVLAWNLNPWLMVLILSPLAIVYQAFQLPHLQTERVQVLESERGQLSRAYRDTAHLNEELFALIAHIFDAREPRVGGHTLQVVRYAVRLGEEMGFSAERLEQLRQAAFLHDIGKIAIPETLLNKTARLTDPEYAAIQRHAPVGAALIESSDRLRHLAPFVRHHHERWDGLGYPNGLCGEQIPLEARILCVCDAVETMASDRPYRRGLPMDNITAELKRCRGTQFDPLVADMFIHIIEREGSEFLVNSAQLPVGKINRRSLMEQHPGREASPAKPEAEAAWPGMQGSPR